MQIPYLPRACGLLALLPLAAALHARNIDRYISPSGNDANDGLTAATPWQSLLHARTEIRSLIPGQTADIVLHFASGEYPVTSTLYYTSADSGQGSCTVTYVSDAGPGQAAIVGASAQTFTGPGPIYALSGLAFSQPPEVLYESGLPSWPARAPKRNPSNYRYPLARSPYATAASGTGASGSDDVIIFNSGDFSGLPAESTWTLTNARLQWWRGADTANARRNWGIDVPDTVVGRNTGGTGFVITQDTNDVPFTGERYYIENVPELLTAPGEFTYDPSASTLTYYPRSATPNSADIRIPTLSTLLNLNGTSNMVFDGLKFAYTTTYVSPNVIHAALEITGATADTVTHCEFTAVGGAIEVYGVNTGHTISHCWIHGCGMGGVWLIDTNARAAVGDPSTASSGHRVTDCLISEIGEVEPSAIYSAGVLVISCQDCTVDHCEIYNSVRYATSLRGNFEQVNQGQNPDNGENYATNNLFEYLRVHACLLDSGDGGAVHAAGVNEASGPYVNTWNQLLISDGYADTSMLDIPPDGMFFDYPGQTLEQSLSDIDITFTQNATGGDAGFRSHGNGGTYTGQGTPGESISNASWLSGFSAGAMDFANIGLTSDFPRASFALLPNYPAAEIDGVALADDHTIDFSLTGSWSDSSAPGLLNGDGSYHGANSSGDYAEWRPTLPYTGAYQVSVWQIPGVPGASGAAPFAITDRSGLTNETVDQLDGGSGWDTFTPTFSFFAGRGTSSGYVRLTATSSGAVRADAVKFTYLGSANVEMGGETGWWKLDSDASDSSGNGLSGSGTGSPLFGTPATVGTGALQLDGSSYETVTKNALLDIGSGDFAVSLWFYLTDSSAANERLVAKGADTDAHPGYCLFAGATAVSAAIGNGTTRIIVTAPHAGLNTWNHVVLNIDRSGSATVYVNGVNAASADISGWSGTNLSNTSWNLYLGSNAGSLDWKGAIDDVRIYQRLLTDSEIQSLVRP